MREAFLQRAVMKSDIYINTTAGEFKKYMELIDTFKPFHVVLDGLNAAYSYQGFLSKKNLSMHVSYIFFKIQCIMFSGYFLFIAVLAKQKKQLSKIRS